MSSLVEGVWSKFEYTEDPEIILSIRIEKAPFCLLPRFSIIFVPFRKSENPLTKLSVY